MTLRGGLEGGHTPRASPCLPLCLPSLPLPPALCRPPVLCPLALPPVLPPRPPSCPLPSLSLPCPPPSVSMGGDRQTDCLANSHRKPGSLSAVWEVCKGHSSGPPLPRPTHGSRVLENKRMACCGCPASPPLLLKQTHRPLESPYWLLSAPRSGVGLLATHRPLVSKGGQDFCWARDRGLLGHWPPSGCEQGPTLHPLHRPSPQGR